VVLARFIGVDKEPPPAVATPLYLVIGILTGQHGRELPSLASHKALEKTEMPRAVADQFAENPVAAGVKRTHGIVGVSLNGLTDAIHSAALAKIQGNLQ
jgi:hypothetical protein